MTCQHAASEVAGEAAAALAAAYIALGRTDEAYLTAAESLYAWGVSTSQSYADSGGRGSTIQNWLYPSTVLPASAVPVSVPCTNVLLQCWVRVTGMDHTRWQLRTGASAAVATE